MSFLVRMTFHVQKTDDGLYHVQNAVMGLSGQHHVHTEKGYKAWTGLMLSAAEREHSIRLTKGGSCKCGLRPGDVRDHDGLLWRNEKWAQ